MARRKESLGLTLCSLLVGVCALTKSRFVRPWLPLLPSRRDIPSFPTPCLSPCSSEPGPPHQSCHSCLPAAPLGWKAAEPTLLQVQTWEELPRQRKQAKKTVGHPCHHPSLAQQVKGLLSGVNRNYKEKRHKMKGSWQEKSRVQGKGYKETPQEAAKTVRGCRLEKSVADTEVCG